jgi:hypothetical protein
MALAPGLSGLPRRSSCAIIDADRLACLLFLISFSKEGPMEEHECGLRVGQSVPDLKIETFDPVKADFSEIDIGALGKAGKWTVLFFYPADFTFV